MRSVKDPDRGERRDQRCQQKPSDHSHSDLAEVDDRDVYRCCGSESFNQNDGYRQTKDRSNNRKRCVLADGPHRKLPTWIAVGRQDSKVGVAFAHRERSASSSGKSPMTMPATEVVWMGCSSSATI